MKKLILLSLVIFAILVNSFGADRTGIIPSGLTTLSKPMTFGASDTIVSGTTTTFLITNLQKFLQHQTFTFTLAAVTGTHNMAITAYGKVNSTSAWVQIGSPITWVTAANNGSITSAAPLNYNYFKITFVESGSSCKATVSNFEIKTANVFSLGGGNAYVLGNTGATMEMSSSDWAISATGAMTGIGAITSNGLITGSAGATITGAAVNLNASSNFATNIGTGTTTQAVTVGNANNTIALVSPTTVTGSLTATGGIAFPTGSTVFWAKGGTPVAVATGTDATPSAGARYWVEIEIPHNASLTGLSYLVGSVGGTDSVMVNLFNSAGTLAATSKKTGAAHGDIVGSAAQIQSVAFTTPYAAVAGKYFASVQFNGTTARFRTYLIPGCKFVANTAAGTYDTAVASITPGTTFVADKGPIVATY